MASQYYNVTTNNGDAKIANSIATATKLNITHVVFGDGNGSVPTPDKSRTAMVNEVYRVAPSSYYLHPTIANRLIVEALIPSNIGGFYIREVGLIADTTVLISDGSVAPIFKEASTDGTREYKLKFAINIVDSSVVNITLDSSLIYVTQDTIVDNLTTADATKPLSAKQGKELQDTKLDENKVGEAGGVASLDENKKVPVVELPSAKDTTAGIMKLINDLITGGNDAALTAEMGKVFFNMFANTLTENGRMYLPNPTIPSKPIIVQWGSGASGASGVSAKTMYSISCTTKILGVALTMVGINSYVTLNGTYAHEQPLDGVMTSTPIGVVQGFNYIAIGY